MIRGRKSTGMLVDYDTSTPGIQSMPAGVTRDESGAIDFGPDMYAPRRGAKTKFDRGATPQTLARAAEGYAHPLSAVRSMLHYQDKGDYRGIGSFLNNNDLTSNEWDAGYNVLNQAFSLKEQGYTEREINDIITGKSKGKRRPSRTPINLAGENPMAGLLATPEKATTPIVTPDVTDAGILSGKDLNGDGIVTDDERNSPYTSAANTAIDTQYASNGQGMGSVYITSAGGRDDKNMTTSERFEILTRANDKLLGEGQEWGFEDGAHGQWGTYGGPGFAQDAEKTARIDFSRTGFGDAGLVGGPRRLGQLYKDAEWTKAEVSKAQLGQVIDTPMGQYMVVNGMDGQLALKGLKGSRHGGGNYFYSMVDEGYHMGINPETGEVWFQQAPDVVALADRVREAGGDFITAMTSGLYSGDLGVWTPERVERFLNNRGGQNDFKEGHWSGGGGGPLSWSDLEWNAPKSGGFLGAYNEQRAKKPSVMSLFKDMIDYGG